MLNGFTREELGALFLYDPETGVFTRRVARSANAPAGAVVGTLDGRGYLHVSITKRFVRLHRIAFFLMHGVVPPEVDHVDGVRTNNRAANLRAATRQQNAGNSRASSLNTSGFKGVSRNSRSGKWHAQIKINGHQVYLGRFNDPIEAARQYDFAALQHFGDRARLNGV